MKIFVVARGCPNKKNSYLGIFEFDQAKALQKAGHDVTFISVDLRSIRRKRKWGYNSYIQEDVKVEEINIPLGRLPWKMLGRFGAMGMGYTLKKAIKKYGEPEVIHGHFVDVAEMLFYTEIPKEAIYVITEHSSKINLNLSLKRIDYYKKLYDKADVVIAVSQSLKENMDKLFGVRSVYIPNIVDNAKFYYQERKKTDKFKYITVGTLNKNKNIQLTIDSFKNICDRYNDVELEIIGEGEEKEILQASVNKYGLTDKVTFWGRVERSFISRRMQETNCFVLASNGETFGVVYIEALASGLPVIATRCGGPESFVDKDNGILIDVGDLHGLTEAMIYIHDNGHHYDMKEISTRAIDMFSGESVAKQLGQLYDLNRKMN